MQPSHIGSQVRTHCFRQNGPPHEPPPFEGPKSNQPPANRPAAPNAPPMLFSPCSNSGPTGQMIELPIQSCHLILSMRFLHIHYEGRSSNLLRSSSRSQSFFASSLRSDLTVANPLSQPRCNEEDRQPPPGKEKPRQ